MISNVEEADKALEEIGRLERDISLKNAAMNETIDFLKNDTELLTEPMTTEIDRLTKELETFAVSNKPALFAKRRTIRLTFGEIGFRTATEIKPEPWNSEEGILELAKEYDSGKFVRTKEFVDKEALKKATDVELAEVGAYRNTREIFWRKTKEVELKRSESNG